MKLIQIAAIGANRELGYQGDMPWGHSLKKDLSFFKKQTMGHPMVMGRRTFESLPGMLPGRLHIVISTTQMPEKDNLIQYPSLEAFLQAWKDKDCTVYVTGGASLYEQLLDASDELILTEIEGQFQADTYYPAFDQEQFEKRVLDEMDDGGYHYQHICYKRK